MTDKHETERAAARTVAQLDRAPGKSAEAEDTGGHGFESHQSASAALNDEKDEFKPYRRSQIAELAAWRPGMHLAGVSISQADWENGSPKPGDMIARNPKDHADRWLVAKQYFEDNFEVIESIQSANASSDVVRDRQRHALVEVICALQERVESLAVKLIKARNFIVEVTRDPLNSKHDIAMHALASIDLEQDDRVKRECGNCANWKPRKVISAFGLQGKIGHCEQLKDNTWQSYSCVQWATTASSPVEPVESRSK